MPGRPLSPLGALPHATHLVSARIRCARRSAHAPFPGPTPLFVTPAPPPLCHPGLDPGSSRGFPDRCHRWRAGATAGSGATAVLDPGFPARGRGQARAGVTKGGRGRRIRGAGGLLAACHGMSCFVMAGGGTAVSGRVEGAGPPEPVGAVLPALPDVVQWRQQASRRKGREAVGSGKVMGNSFIPFRFDGPAALAPERPCFARYLRARLCRRGRACRGGAARAPDCARETQDTPRLSAESGSFRTGPARAGSGSGCLFLRTHHTTVL